MAEDPTMPGEKPKRTRDARLLRKAIRLGWLDTADRDKLQAVKDKVVDIALTEDGRSREHAIDSLLAMREQDLELVKLAQRETAMANDAEADHSGPVQVVINTRPMKGDNDTSGSNADTTRGGGGSDSGAD